MATEKSIKIQKNKVLTYSINKEGFKTVYGSTLVNENKDINVKLYNLNTPDQDGPYKLGDRLFEISIFVNYFTPSGTYDVDSLKYISASQTTGSGLTNIQVVKGTSNTAEETGTWLSKVEKDLQIVTPKGSSNTFIFTYNGTTWDITGTLTLAGQSLADYGISCDGTPTNGDVITVTETQYNKFAVYVLDANYRSLQSWGPENPGIMPKRYSNPNDCIESATYYNQYIWNNTNLSSYSIFNFCKNKGNFILPNGIKINCMVPNGPELQSIYNNRVVLDSFDPVIQGGSSTYNLTNWAFTTSYYGQFAWSCIEYTSTRVWRFNRSGSWSNDGGYHSDDPNKGLGLGVAPIFEVPVM